MTAEPTYAPDLDAEMDRLLTAMARIALKHYRRKTRETARGVRPASASKEIR